MNACDSQTYYTVHPKLWSLSFAATSKKYAKDLDPTTGWEGQPQVSTVIPSCFTTVTCLRSCKSLSASFVRNLASKVTCAGTDPRRLRHQLLTQLRCILISVVWFVLHLQLVLLGMTFCWYPVHKCRNCWPDLFPGCNISLAAKWR